MLYEIRKYMRYVRYMSYELSKLYELCIQVI